MPRRQFSVSASINADSTGLNRGLNRAAKSYESTGKRIGRALTNAAKVGAAAGAALAASLVAATRASANLADELGKSARAVGFASDEYQQLVFAIERVGGNVNNAERAILRFQQVLAGISGATGRQVFERLGLDLERLRTIRPEEGFDELLQALSQVGNLNERNAAAVELFGTRNAKTILLLAENLRSFNIEQERSASIGFISEESIANAESLNDAIADVTTAIRTGFANAVLREGVDRNDEWTESLAELRETIEVVASKTVPALGESLQGAIKLLGDFFRGLDRIIEFFGGGEELIPVTPLSMARDRVEEIAIHMERLAAAIEDTGDPTGGLAREMARLEGASRDARDEFARLYDESQNTATSLGAISVTAEDAEDGLGNITTTVTELTDELKQLQQEGNNWRTDIPLITFEMREFALANLDAATANERMREEFGETFEDIDRQFEGLVDITDNATDEVEEIWSNMVSNMQQEFADTIYNALWENGIDSFSDFGDAILDIWKKAIAQMIAAWTTSGITGLLSGQGFGGFNTGIFGGGGGGSGSLLGGIGSAFKGFGAALKSAAPFILGAAILFKGLVGSTKTIDSGFRVLVNETDSLVEEFKTIRRKRLFGLIRSTRTTVGEADAEISNLFQNTITTVADAIAESFGALSLASSFTGFAKEFELSLHGLDEAARETAIQDLLKEIAGEMGAFAFAGNGLSLSAESAAAALERMTTVSELLEAAADRAASIAEGRIDTLQTLTSQFAQLTNEELSRLFVAATTRVDRDRTGAAQAIIDSISALRETRDTNARQAELVLGVIEQAGLSISGINDLQEEANNALTDTFNQIADDALSHFTTVNEQVDGFASALASAAENIRNTTDSLIAQNRINTRLLVEERNRRANEEAARITGGLPPTTIPGGQPSQTTVMITQNVTGDVTDATLAAIRDNTREIVTELSPELSQVGSGSRFTQV